MKKIKLGDVLDVKRGQSISGEYFSEEGHFVRLTLGNFNYPGGGFKKNTSKTDIYYLGDVKPEFLMKEGDIITPLTEQVSGLLGETATIPEDDLYIQNGDVGKVIPDEKLLNKRFAYYLVSSPVIKKQLDASAQQTKIRHTSPDAIKGCVTWIPENVDEQKRIAKLLDDINFKISLNNSICSDLEAMAKQLYDYWFVQFDFPDENGKPYKTSGGKMVWNEELKREIPEGWKVEKFDNIVAPSPKLKAIKAPDYKEKGKYPIVDQASNLITGYTDDDSYLFDNINECVVFGDVTTYFKYINFPFAKGTDGTKIIQSIDNRIPALLLYYLIKDCKLPNIGFARHYMFLREIKVLIPDKKTCHMYDIATKHAMNKRKEIILENQQLTSLRDFLLPMLMNGQVKVG